ncbi:Isoleucine--tRNA ligase [Labeo rohita]|uniref:Isoleucine--tRNA ligase n=1 Tax=Labeo rohita TaxID=84645 RepID=A0ABQ8MMB1_LABRO|nr:Isoleucine--tRNA ligase [Labeo rohita]
MSLSVQCSAPFCLFCTCFPLVVSSAGMESQLYLKTNLSTAAALSSATLTSCLEEYIQNSAARILMAVRKYDHVTSILKSLHWLPVSLRIVYKVSLLTHQCIHGDAPHLKELLTPQTSKHTLRSASAYFLKPSRTKLQTMGDRAFCSAECVQCSPSPSKGSSDCW